MHILGKKYYLAGDLFPENRGAGAAQIPFLYDENHRKLLSDLMLYGIPGEDEKGRYLVLHEEPTYGSYILKSLNPNHSVSYFSVSDKNNGEEQWRQLAKMSPRPRSTFRCLAMIMIPVILCLSCVKQSMRLIVTKFSK